MSRTKKTVELLSGPGTPSTSPNSIVVVTSPGGRQQSFAVEVSESVESRIEKWYLNPLRRMSGPEGFSVLMILLPLYERHLRIKCKMGEKEKFSQGHRALDAVGADLKLSREQAFQFWTHIRNGLIHSAQPKQSESFKYGITTEGPPIRVEGSFFWINPFEMRDRLLEKIEPELNSWKRDDVPLASSFQTIKL